MEIKQIVVGAYQTNCFILVKDSHVIIIDPGKNAKRIMANIDSSFIVDAILLTHGHFDHIGAVDDLVDAYNCPIYIHEEDDKLIHNCPYNSMNGMSGKIHHKVNYFEDVLEVGPFKFDVIHAPGHTDGSVLLCIDDHMFAGDVLFEGSIGRTDLYSGSDSKMRQSLKYIKTMNPLYHVYPGHGNTTTLLDELYQNPFLI